MSNDQLAIVFLAISCFISSIRLDRMSRELEGLKKDQSTYWTADTNVKGR